MDPSKKVPDLNCEVQDLLLEVVDLKYEVPDLRCGGIRPNLTPGRNAAATSSPDTGIISGVAMRCAGCAMHKGPVVISGISFFCFPMQNVVKSTEIYTFSTRTHTTVVC